MAHFNIEIAKATTGEDNYRDGKGPKVAVTYTTNNVIDFTDYVTSAIEHYKAMVRFDTTTEYVAMLIRTLDVHHTVYITWDTASQSVVVKS